MAVGSQERDVLPGGSDSPGGILEICSFLVSMARHTAAAEAYRRASELAQTPAEIAYLSSRAEEYTTPG
jgi:hypothetical protein